MDFSIIEKIIVAAIPILLAVTVHEAAHAWSADKLGDATARQLGRVSFNPFKHIDLLGTIILPTLLLVTSGFVFGWAKPVPVNLRNFHKPTRDFAIVAIFGPLSNLLMAVAWSGVFAIAYAFSTGTNEPVVVDLMRQMGQTGVVINVMLMIFNLLPIPPLDGSRLLTAILPKPMVEQIFLYEKYGFVILIVLMLLGFFKYLIPFVLWFSQLLIHLFI